VFPTGQPGEDDEMKNDGSQRHAAGPRRRWVAAGVAAVVVAGGAAALVVTSPSRHSASPGAPAASTAFPTATATVTRQSLTAQTPVSATLGDAGSYSVVNQAPGTITWLPAVGQVIRQGQMLYQVAGSPVVLLQGAVPAYRDLSGGMTGTDVAELNADLIALGYASKAELGPESDYFSSATAAALEELQARLGLTVTGTLPLGQAVFLPVPAALITGEGSDAVQGGQAAPGSVLLTASSTTPVVTIDLDASQQTEVADKDPVTITLPSGATTAGVISQVGSVASVPSSSADGGNASGSTPTITVLVSLTDPAAAAGLNQAPVQVGITTGSAPDALAVPQDALVAQANGYDIEVVSGRSDRWIPVTPGVFDDATEMVQVTGAGVAAGERVVVPVWPVDGG
jgi:peptidoglycan hydrolase-like protein with peptidoglycan-binding domain